MTYFFVGGKGISTITSERTCINTVHMWERIFMILCVFIFLIHFAALLCVLDKRSNKRWNVGIKTSGTSVFQYKPRLVLFITCWGAWTEQWLGYKRRKVWLLRLCDAEILAAGKLSSVLLVHCLTCDLGFSLNSILIYLVSYTCYREILMLFGINSSDVWDTSREGVILKRKYSKYFVLL